MTICIAHYLIKTRIPKHIKLNDLADPSYLTPYNTMLVKINKY